MEQGFIKATSTNLRRINFLIKGDFVPSNRDCENFHVTYFLIYNIKHNLALKDPL